MITRGNSNKYSLGQYAGVCAILLSLSAVIVWLAFHMRARTIAILDRGVLTQATAGRQYHGKSSGTSYRFIVNGATYTGTTPNLFTPNETIDVRYVPDNPSDNAEDGTLSRRNADHLAWGSLAVGPVYCLIAGIIFWVMRQRSS